MAESTATALDDLPPLQTTDVDGRNVAWREAGAGPALVLLHGIGSGSQSWRAQLAAFSASYRVIAWDAPGYGGSDPLPGDDPPAINYASALQGLLAELGVSRAHIVGHSLGAIMAASFCRIFGAAVATVTLADPASGYGAADDQLRQERLDARLHLIDGLGPEGMARERAHVLLSPEPPSEALALVKEVMRGLNPHGYRQATRLLCFGDIFADLPYIAAPALVMCGSADTVTPEEGCREVAAAIAGATYRTLPGLGHASYVEGPELFNAALGEFLRDQA